MGWRGIELAVAGLAGLVAGCFSDSGEVDAGSGSCVVGEEGCGCTTGGGCDPGLICTEIGCVTRGGTTTATTADASSTDASGMTSSGSGSAGASTTVSVDDTMGTADVGSDTTSMSMSEDSTSGPMPLGEPHVHLYFHGPMDDAGFLDGEPASTRQDLDGLCELTNDEQLAFADHCNRYRVVLSIDNGDDINDHRPPDDIPVTGPTDLVVKETFASMLNSDVALDLSFFAAGVALGNEDRWWSGSLVTGEDDMQYRCNGWVESSSTQQGRVGLASEVDGEWIRHPEPVFCNTSGIHLLCACWNEF